MQPSESSREVLRAASEMARETGLNPGLVIGTTSQLLRAVDERTDSILRHGTGPGKNLTRTTEQEYYRMSAERPQTR